MSWNCKRIYIAAFNLQQALYQRYYDAIYGYLLQHLPSDWIKQTVTQNLCQVQQNQFTSKVLQDPKNVGICLATAGVLQSALLNKTKNIRAALVHTQYIAKMCRQHNDANICIIPTDCIGQKLAADLILHYLRNQFDGEVKNKMRLGIISQFQNKYSLKIQQ